MLRMTSLTVLSAASIFYKSPTSWPSSSRKGACSNGWAERTGKTVIQCFGSVKNIARRVLECFRYKVIPDAAYDTLAAACIQIRLDSS